MLIIQKNGGYKKQLVACSKKNNVKQQEKFNIILMKYYKNRLTNFDYYGGC